MIPSNAVYQKTLFWVNSSKGEPNRKVQFVANISGIQWVYYITFMAAVHVYEYFVLFPPYDNVHTPQQIRTCCVYFDIRALRLPAFKCVCAYGCLHRVFVCIQATSIWSISQYYGESRSYIKWSHKCLVTDNYVLECNNGQMWFEVIHQSMLFGPTY